MIKTKDGRLILNTKKRLGAPLMVLGSILSGYPMEMWGRLKDRVITEEEDIEPMILTVGEPIPEREIYSRSYIGSEAEVKALKGDKDVNSTKL